MKMMEPCLLTGPFDWSPDFLPRAEFDARLARARGVMRDMNVGKLVVHGNVFDHGALAWLTGFTPKLGPAFALVPLEGPMRIVFSGGPGMKPSAERLTFVEDIAAFRGVAADIGPWIGDARTGLCEGAAMAFAPWSALDALAAGKGGLVAMDAAIDALGRSKTPVERKATGQAIEILEATSRVLVHVLKELGRRGAILAAEAAAFSFGAQDARLRMSIRPLGPPAPLASDDEKTREPRNVAIAIRFRGYWAAGHFVAGEIAPDLARNARGALEGALARTRPGARARDVCAAGGGVTLGGHGVGLRPEEAPFLDATETLAEGDVFSLVATIDAGENKTAAWSVLALVEQDGARVLWAAPGLDIPVPRD